MVKVLEYLILFSLLFTGLYLPVFASDCDDVLEELSKRNSEVVSITADYTLEKYLSLVEDTLESRGKFMFNAPDKFRWETLSPEQSTIICDGSAIKIYYPEIDELDEYPVTRYKWLPDLFKDLPMSSQFDAENLQNKYSIKLGRDYYDKRFHALRLKPQPDENQGGYKLIELILAKKDLSITKIIFHEFDDDKMTIKFFNIVHNKKIPVNIFTEIKSKEEKK